VHACFVRRSVFAFAGSGVGVGVGAGVGVGGVGLAWVDIAMAGEGCVVTGG